MKQTNLGDVKVSVEAIASYAGTIVSECYGVVGMASKNLIRDTLAELLRKENYSKGIVVRETKSGLELDIYIVVCYGVKVIEVASEVQKKVKYELEKMLDVDFAAVNVFVQGVRDVD